MQVDLIELIGGDWPIESGGKITSALAPNHGTLSKSNQRSMPAPTSERIKSINPLTHIVADKRKTSHKKSNIGSKIDDDLINSVENNQTTKVGHLIGEEKYRRKFCM